MKRYVGGGGRRTLASVQTMNIVVSAGARSTIVSEEAAMAAPNVVAAKAEMMRAAIADFMLLVVEPGVVLKVGSIEDWRM